jgi:AraC-like DNA-binding protein
MHSGLELILVEQGEIQVSIGNITQILTQGDIGIAFPNQLHSYDSEGMHGISKGTLILCPAEMSGDFLSTLLISHPVHPFIVKDQVHTDIHYALNSLLQTRPDQPDNLPVIRAYIQLVLSRLLPILELSKNRDSQDTSLASQLVTFLSDHYTEQVSLDTLSKQFGISRYIISRFFSDKLHTSFSNYLNTLRIDYAKLLLQGSNLDILTISMMCGYENSRTFNREFKTICNCQPREYRSKKR